MRNVLSYIAAANGGSFVITQMGTLLLVRPKCTASQSDAYNVGNECEELNILGDSITLGKVTMVCDENTIVESGTSNGYDIEVDCPYATQTIVDFVKTTLSGVIYRPYEPKGAELDPTYEVYDSVYVGDFISVVSDLTIAYNVLPIADFSALAADEIGDEYGFSDTVDNRIKRMIS